jgi:hypothetical protein
MCSRFASAFRRDSEPIGIDISLTVSLRNTMYRENALVLAGARVSRVYTYVYIV